MVSKSASRREAAAYSAAHCSKPPITPAEASCSFSEPMTPAYGARECSGSPFAHLQYGRCPLWSESVIDR